MKPIEYLNLSFMSYPLTIQSHYKYEVFHSTFHSNHYHLNLFFPSIFSSTSKEY
jgi:hypothetical protein